MEDGNKKEERKMRKGKKKDKEKYKQKKIATRLDKIRKYYVYYMLCIHAIFYNFTKPCIEQIDQTVIYWTNWV